MLVWFAETTIVAGILALVALAVSRLKPISPSVKHALWLVVLIKFVTPPVVSWPWADDWQGQLSAPGAHQVEYTAAVAAEEPSLVAPIAHPAGYSEPPEDCGDTLTVAENQAEMPSDGVMATAEVAPEDAESVVPAAMAPASVASGPTFWPSSEAFLRWIMAAWVAVSGVLALGQAIRIIKFRRRLRGALPAPDHLIDEAIRIGQWLDVSVPDLRVVEDLGTPLLWCLGRPQLLLPARLVKTLPFERWRGILTHELAHLRRRDQWVCRLELAAGLVWWWNPLYWLTRARLDAEAELACDAWVVWALPKDRLSYAEVLFDICSTLSLAKPVTPALGVAGSGRFFERRLTMILHNHVPCRLSPLGLLGACLLVLFALPSWSTAKLVSSDQDSDTASIAATQSGGETNVSLLDDDDDDDDDDKDAKSEKRRVKAADDDDDEDDADDDDDEDDDDDDELNEKALERAKAKVEAIKRKLEAKTEKAKAKAKGKEQKVKKLERELDVDKLEKEIESKRGSGSDFEKQMEQLGEKIGKEMEAKFGPGSEFEKQMKNLGKELEGKFGDGSDFAKKMEAFGKEMEAKFGPGSEFEAKMKKLGEEMKEKYGPGSEFAEKLHKKAAEAVESSKGSSSGKDGGRERKIKALEEQVAKLIEQIKELKRQGDDD